MSAPVVAVEAPPDALDLVRQLRARVARIALAEAVASDPQTGEAASFTALDEANEQLDFAVGELIALERMGAFDWLEALIVTYGEVFACGGTIARLDPPVLVGERA